MTRQPFFHPSLHLFVVLATPGFKYKVNSWGASQGCIKLGRSADFQSAVSQVCNLHAARFSNAHRAAERAAGCNPAIQQVTNLRYEGDPGELDAALALVEMFRSGRLRSGDAEEEPLRKSRRVG
jgi:hypothetical protein